VGNAAHVQFRPRKGARQVGKGSSLPTLNVSLAPTVSIPVPEKESLMSKASGPERNAAQAAGPAADPDCLTGTEIAFATVGEKIGEGAHGEVYAGTTTEGARVAIKFLRKELCGQDQEVVGRFMREIKLAKDLEKHENIARVITSGFHQPSGRWYAIMEFAEGESLSSILERRPNGLPVQVAIKIIMPVLRALRYADQHNVVHRDIKPENIVVNYLKGSDGSIKKVIIKVLDWGVAHISDPTIHGGVKLTVDQALIGTPQYMSPEQAKGDPDIDRRSDLYSAGLVLYEMLTGQLPFHAETTMELIVKQIRDTPPRPTTFKPDIPRKLDDVVMMLLSKDREKRPRSADLAIRLLESATHGFRDSLARTLLSTIDQNRSDDWSSILSTLSREKAENGVKVNDPTEMVKTRVFHRRSRFRVVGLSALGVLVMAALILIPWMGDRRNSHQSGVSGRTADRSSKTVSDRSDRSERPAVRETTRRLAVRPERESVAPPAPTKAAPANDELKLLREECLSALRSRKGFSGPCDRYLERRPDDEFVRNMRDFLNNKRRR